MKPKPRRRISKALDTMNRDFLQGTKPADIAQGEDMTLSTFSKQLSLKGYRARQVWRLERISDGKFFDEIEAQPSGESPAMAIA